MIKQPTIHDVAKAAGMHKSTVSVALSGKGNLSATTRARVLEVARELGYEPNPMAQRLAHGQSDGRICLVCGDLDIGLATEKVSRIQRALTNRGLEAPIYTFSEPLGKSGRSQAAQFEQLRRQRPRAIICAAQMVTPSTFHALETYQKSGGIVICFDTPVPLQCDQIIFDREDNAYQAAHYLLQQGHRKLGLGMSSYTLSQLNQANTSASLRFTGFKRALAEWNVPLREEWLFANAVYEAGGAEMAQRFLAMKDRPTGLCIVNDYVALAFMTEVIRAGVKIPDDISIIGHDDQPISNYCPVPLTAVSQPVETIASTVVELLHERLLHTQGPERTIKIRGALIERESVKKLD